MLLGWYCLSIRSQNTWTSQTWWRGEQLYFNKRL